MDTSTVTDSTDWLSTPLSGLAPIEASLQCQVCKEILKTPTITSCEHTFCNVCIRRSLSHEGKCPSCRKDDQERNLRHNLAVEELVRVWEAVRKGVWDVAVREGERQRNEGQRGVRGEQEGERPKKRRRIAGEQPPVVVVQKSGLEERRSTRSQSRRGASLVHSQSQSQSQSQASQPLRSTQEEIADSDGASEYQESPSRAAPKQQSQPAEPNDGLVGCPSCARRMKEANINSHLDRCLQGNASPTPPPQPAPAQAIPASAQSPNSHFKAGTIAYTQTKPTLSSKKLGTLNYHTFTEAKLRSKLKELGIPNTGSKEQMRRRHGEWYNLWNANCDSLEPVSKSKLLRELDTWERNAAKDERNRNAGVGGGGGAVIMNKEFDREGYSKREKDSFSDLVKMARESAKKAAATKKDEGEAQEKEACESAGQPSMAHADSNPSQSDMPMLDVGGSAVHTDPETSTGASHGIVHDAAPTAGPIAETLVPNTPTRPQPNGYHVEPDQGQQDHRQPPQQGAIDLTSPSPRKEQNAYQQYPLPAAQQQLERASQVSL